MSEVGELSEKAARIEGSLKAMERWNVRTSAMMIESQRLDFVAHAAAASKSHLLACFSERSFSQNGEDGILSEIFARLNGTVRSFVEIGAGDGTENNTIRWLLDGASGLWIEADAGNLAGIRRCHQQALEQGRLTVLDSFVSAENIDAILSEYAAADTDLLTIDIDGNDYWVWQAITCISPRVVVMEYNGRYGSSLSWVMRYDPSYRWPGGVCHFGASLKALEKLGIEKGYTLIGVDFMGVNAFFLRSDLLDGQHFPGPYTSETLFQPFRRGYGQLPTGKAASFGPYVNV